MKNVINIFFNKILGACFLAFLLSCFLASPLPTQAKINASTPTWAMPDLQIDISGLKGKFSTPKCTGDDKNRVCEINWIAEYISGVYKYAIGIVGILATVVMMVGGFLWLTAGGNASQVKEGQEWIKASLTGLVIALSSYMILFQVNPDLVKLKPIKVARVEKAPEAATPYTGLELKCNWTNIPLPYQGSCKNYLGVLWKNKESECSGEKPLGKTCCCPDYGAMGGSWQYDSEAIKSQITKASGDLLSLLGCMRSKIPSNVGKISSITGTGHTNNSCHYNSSGSYAVDIGDGGKDAAQTINAAIVKAATECDSEAFIDCENNHIHISVKKCTGDQGLGNRCNK